MATLQGQVNNTDISERIYQDIMNVASSRHPQSNRANSAKSVNTQISFITSPHNSARSKTSQCSKQGAYSDFDIIRNRSWSGSKVKSSHFGGKTGPLRGDSTPRSCLLPPSFSDSRTSLTPTTSTGSAGSIGDSKGKQLNKELWNLRGSQVQRLHQEWAAIEQCRAMKRASEMVQHRLDPMYRISGSTIPLLARYQVNDTELQRLREMSETSRILQLDLKRIKYREGGRSPRRETSNTSKSHSKTRYRGGEEGKGGREEDQRRLNDIDTSPISDLNPTAANQHPTSPVSTPEGTPRDMAADGQAGSS